MFGYNKNDTNQPVHQQSNLATTSPMAHPMASEHSMPSYPHTTNFPAPPAPVNNHHVDNISPMTMPQEPLITSGATKDDLISLRLDALNTLRPLLKNLHLPPTEMFKVMLRLIQSADDPSLIPSAYQIALSIDDDDEKAQALLDIVNEINYFTKKLEN